jgi:hypothetical protein
LAQTRLIELLLSNDNNIEHLYENSNNIEDGTLTTSGLFTKYTCATFSYTQLLLIDKGEHSADVNTTTNKETCDKIQSNTNKKVYDIVKLVFEPNCIQVNQAQKSSQPHLTNRERKDAKRKEKQQRKREQNQNQGSQEEDLVRNLSVLNL